MAFKLPGFEVIEKVGEGGMATVWKARQVSLDRTVAVKILSSGLATDPDDVRRFQTEAQSAAKLKHPGIIQVYDANALDGMYYFVMEFIAGYTVGDWTRRKGVLEEKEAILVADCVSDALQYAWEKEGIIHCDIKPDNIMVDADGTVKVADLGLARTISAMTEEGESDDVMGTPAYISPEQSVGASDLDCRADIYSLGATLYFLLTGKLLFQGHSDDEAMEMQVTETVDDAMDINPHLSKAMCWLLEKMMAKDKDDRHKNWKEVRGDIARVKRGLIPTSGLVSDNASTMRRSAKRRKADATSPASSRKHAKKGNPLLTAAIAIGVMLVIGAAIILLGGKGNRSTTPSPKVTTPTRSTNQGEPASRAAEAKRMYDYVVEWFAKHPTSFDEAHQRFKRVMTQTRGTKYSLMAEEQMTDITAAKKAAIADVLASLKKDTAYLISAGSLLDAAREYELYNGALVKESETQRLRQAKALRKQSEDEEEAAQKRKQEAKRAFSKKLESIVDDLLDSGVSGALVLAKKHEIAEQKYAKKKVFAGIRALLQKALALDKVVMETFKADRGREITVLLNSGSHVMKIDSVSSGRVSGYARLRAGRSSAKRPISFHFQDLAARERLRRMGNDKEPAVALTKGLMAVTADATSYAITYFSAVPAPLGPLLVKRLGGAVDQDPLEDITSNASSEDVDAEDALRLILRVAGITVGPYDRKAWLGAVNRHRVPTSSASRVLGLVDNYRRKYGNTGFAKKAKAVIQALENIKTR